MNRLDILQQVQTPSYVIDEQKLIDNLIILRGLEERTGCHVLLAQKAYSAFATYPLIRRYISGATASGLYEARLGHEEMQGENHIFAPAYMEHEFDEILEICDHIVFNSFAQWEKYKNKIKGKASCGIRINPEHSTQGNHALYDPCAPWSRFGVTIDNFREDSLDGIEGLHFHTLCEQDSEDLESTLDVIIEKFGKYLPQMKWINFGGGHHITRDGYDIEKLERCIKRMQNEFGLEVYIEPGEAIALNAGYLVSSLLEVVHNDINIGILDTSATCHMPDVLEVPYRPVIIDSGEIGEKTYPYRFGGNTCLTGDIIGDYSFDEPLKVGDKFVFTDMAIYSMVKNNTFNGIALPSIRLLKTDGTVQTIKEFGYEEFKERLS
ncbi:carboxynorspermidine decarboxylase [Jeotgalibaca sp. A122]|uniref:carboxynorspermidine decarboxylase n=1 Tax=Jeotgalibaca sp. A122 TaxID=3457322 RepID=UPI003FD35518